MVICVVGVVCCVGSSCCFVDVCLGSIVRRWLLLVGIIVIGRYFGICECGV